METAIPPLDIIVCVILWMMAAVGFVPEDRTTLDRILQFPRQPGNYNKPDYFAENMFAL